MERFRGADIRAFLEKEFGDAGGMIKKNEKLRMLSVEKARERIYFLENLGFEKPEEILKQNPMAFTCDEEQIEGRVQRLEEAFAENGLNKDKAVPKLEETPIMLTAPEEDFNEFVEDTVAESLQKKQTRNTKANQLLQPLNTAPSKLQSQIETKSEYEGARIVKHESEQKHEPQPPKTRTRSKIYYFAYGSNLYLEQFRERVADPLIKPRKIAYIPDKWFVFPRKSAAQEGGVASFSYSLGNKLWGAIFELTQGIGSQEERLDTYEGINSKSYRRIRLTELYDENDAPIEDHVFTYIANNQSGGPFIPSRKYLKKIRDGAEECGLPQEHLDALDDLIMQFYPDANL